MSYLNMRYQMLFVAGLVLSVACPAVRAQSTNPFVLLSVSGDGQSTGINRVFPQRLVVRLTNAVGAALPGAHIYFGSFSCLSVLGSPCEFPGAPGHFQSGSANATVATDVDGLAISPAYYAGDSLSNDPRVNDPGAIGVGAYVIPNETPYFFSISATVKILIANTDNAMYRNCKFSYWITFVALWVLAFCMKYGHFAG